MGGAGKQSRSAVVKEERWAGAGRRTITTLMLHNDSVYFLSLYVIRSGMGSSERAGGRRWTLRYHYLYLICQPIWRCLSVHLSSCTFKSSLGAVIRLFSGRDSIWWRPLSGIVCVLHVVTCCVVERCSTTVEKILHQNLLFDPAAPGRRPCTTSRVCLQALLSLSIESRACVFLVNVES